MKVKTYHEPASDLPIYAECDILVVGAGAAGHSAAVAAARAGATNIILMERYGYAGGDVTGDYVLMVPKLSWRSLPFVRGIQEEWFDRMEANAPGSTWGPRMSDIGKSDKALMLRWQHKMDTVTHSDPKMLIRSVYFDGPQLEIELDKMLLELDDRIRVLYHSWGTKPIVEDNVVKGVIFESKEGRQAILAKVVIDATGDGDLYRQSGAPYENLSDPLTRSTTTTLAWRVGGVNIDYLLEWRNAHPEEWRALNTEIQSIAGFRTSAPSWDEPNNNCLMFNSHPKMNCASVADLTATEINTRKSIRDIITYCKQACPGAYRDMYLMSIAPQTGTRCSRRLVGEYIMSPNDWAFATKHDDVIAWHSTICRINDCAPIEIPYRSILPCGIDNLLAPGRHMSTDPVAIDWLNLIPQCIGTGQAAGVAAAVAVIKGTGTHDVDIKRVQDILVEQNVPLPRHASVGKEYGELVEEHEYGLYTELAKMARDDPEEFAKYRQP
ncbi:MAG: FAD-dependent oxidoreductase [Oscillospiraceae bacterium]|nr:FAD-dependent oxidoreductase [Oscillospiraceae bacterium]